MKINTRTVEGKYEIIVYLVDLKRVLAPKSAKKAQLIWRQLDDAIANVRDSKIDKAEIRALIEKAEVYMKGRS